MIPTYNCARFLRQAIESVLNQAPGPDKMQIEVIDDCSDDAPETVVNEVGRGRVVFFKQAQNRGHIANFHTCLVRSRGEFVHLLHGDDFVRPGFYAALERGFEAAPEAGAAFCRAVYADESGTETDMVPEEQPDAGLLSDPLARIASEQRIMTPSIAVKRKVYETLGGFDRRLACAEDWEMCVRIAAHYPIWYEPRPLAVYRMHDASNTGRHFSTAEDAAYNRRAIGIFAGHIPKDRVSAITGCARMTYASSALESARVLRRRGDWAGAFAQVREAFRLAPSAAVVRKALKIALKGRRERGPTR